LLEGRGRLTSAAHWRNGYELASEAHAAGAGLVSPGGDIDIFLHTLKRWQKAVIGDGGGHDRRVIRNPLTDQLDTRKNGVW